MKRRIFQEKRRKKTLKALEIRESREDLRSDPPSRKRPEKEIGRYWEVAAAPLRQRLRRRSELDPLKEFSLYGTKSARF